MYIHDMVNTLKDNVIKNTINVEKLWCFPRVYTYVFGHYVQDRMDYICYNLNNK